MWFQGIRWRIAIPYVILILLTMLVLAIYVSNQLRKEFLDDLQSKLLSDVHLLSDCMGPLLHEQADLESGALDRTVSRWADLLGGRVTLIAGDGTILVESHVDPAQMDNHLNRPEIQQALTEGQGSSIRFSKTMGYEMMYAAKPITVQGEEAVTSIVRVALPLSQIEASISRLRQTVLTAALLAALVAMLLAMLIAERSALPLRRLTRVADRMAAGDLSARLLPSSRDEVGQLTSAFNHMAEQLHEKVDNLAEERGRLAAVLEHMADGVLIADGDGKVQLINPAAARLLRTSAMRATGLSLAQVVRHHRLIDLWKRCREQEKEQVEAMEIRRYGLFLQAIVTPFQQVDARGYLFIIQDLTRVRRLENMRRDFISNISHELRTPLAGLKALVDTLRDGAIEDPPAAERFLTRMDAEVDAMTQMVQELLELSRIESGQVPLRLTPTLVSELVTLPTERLRPQAERAELDLKFVLPPALPVVLADAERVRLVLTNLVHNAIKFTPAGGHVTVSAQPRENKVIFSVQDDGVGIPADDLSRIFERFYKADRARSGGGTGLGLAIAKHIIQGHGGRIWAESVEGKGSTFYFSLSAVK